MLVLNLIHEPSNTAGTGWCFLGKNPFLDRFCVFQRVFPMKTQKVFLKEKSKKHVMCYDSIFTFTFLPIQTTNIYFLFTSFEWTTLLHCSLFWSNNRTMQVHCSLLLIVQRLDWTMVYHCSLVLNFHCLYKYINSSSLQLVLQLVFNKDLYQLNELKTIPLATKALFSLERTWSQTTG